MVYQQLPFAHASVQIELSCCYQLSPADQLTRGEVNRIFLDVCIEVDILELLLAIGMMCGIILEVHFDSF